MASSSSSSSSFQAPPRMKYDVFLSFRGEDTRNNFTSHLHNALCQKGIYSFLDDRRLEKGKTISLELLKAITVSRCAVVVMSENYASSRWCLDELVHIIKCKDKYRQIVLPIFYHVDPFHVRNQTGPFQEIFHKDEEVFKLNTWKNALIQVANLSGFHLEMNMNEGSFIQNFVAHISRKVIVVPFKIPKDIFGIESRLEELNSMVGMGMGMGMGGGVRIIGICGLGGIGKTTLAQIYYKWRCSQFEGSSFLSKVGEVCKTYGERGMTALQQQLLRDLLKEDQPLMEDVYDGADILKARLSGKRVVVVIDDVDEVDQIKNLAGKIFDYVGSGSRVIITTRDESLLIRHGVNSIYKVELFDNEIALKHFSWHAFKKVQPLRDYKRLSQKLVAYAGGLPLALRVLGSFLYGKNLEQWKSALNRLKMRPKKEIVDVLKISYDGLKETDKELFLYIACFFNEEYKDVVKRALQRGFGVYPEIGIAVLIEKSLLSFESAGYSKKRILMHDLLRDMGRDIVREKYALKTSGRRTWLWCPEDMEFVLKNSKYQGKMNVVEAMVYTFTEEYSNLMKICDAISRMKQMRLLFIDFPDISANNNQLNNNNNNNQLNNNNNNQLNNNNNNQLNNIKFLSNELIYIDWYRYPFLSLPSNIQPDSLVELHLPSSKVQQLWDRGTKPLNNLRIINLCDCGELKRMRHFEVVPNVRKLFLKGCVNLSEIGVSISHLQELTLLDMENCNSLYKFPTQKLKSLSSLQFVNLKGCPRMLITNLPQDLVQLKYLKGINVSENHKKKVPTSLKAHIKDFDTKRPICYRRDTNGGLLSQQCF